MSSKDFTKNIADFEVIFFTPSHLTAVASYPSAPLNVGLYLGARV